MQGISSPEISEETLQSMQAKLGGRSCTAANVVNVLRELGLAGRYRRHRFTLVEMLSGEKPEYLPEMVLPDLYRFFRRLEYYWDYYHDEISPGRQVFFSYTFVFYQGMHALGLSRFTGPHHLLKSKHLLQYQKDSFVRASKYTGFKLYD